MCSCSLCSGDLPEDNWSGPVQLFYKTTKHVSLSIKLSQYLSPTPPPISTHHPLYPPPPHPLRVDTLVILTSFVLLILEAVSPAHSVLVVFRPVKFIRLLRLKRRYRDIINTLYVLSRRLISVGLLLFVVYYTFAIIGMEFLSNSVFEGCW